MLVPIGATDVSTSEIRAMTPLGVPIPDLLAASFDLWYQRDGAIVPITLHDLASLTAAHSDGGIISISDGWYKLHLPDAATAAGVRTVLIGGAVTGGVLISAPISLVSHGIQPSGYIPVDHDYPTAGALTIVDPEGVPQENVRIRYYWGPDYEAGHRGPEYVRGETVSLIDGSWQDYIYCFPGDAVFTCFKPGYTLEVKEIVVS